MAQVYPRSVKCQCILGVIYNINFEELRLTAILYLVNKGWATGEVDVVGQLR